MCDTTTFSMPRIGEKAPEFKVKFPLIEDITMEVAT